jgi:hypothetical protein
MGEVDHGSTATHYGLHQRCPSREEGVPAESYRCLSAGHAAVRRPIYPLLEGAGSWDHGVEVAEMPSGNRLLSLSDLHPDRRVWYNRCGSPADGLP